MHTLHFSADLERRSAALLLFVQTYGSEVYWFGTADSPNSGKAIQFNRNEVLVLADYDPDHLIVLPVDDVTFCA